MKPKKTVKIQQNESSLSDKERIRELEAENARLKHEISFYDDFIKEMREIANPNRASKKSPNTRNREIKKQISPAIYAFLLPN